MIGFLDMPSGLSGDMLLGCLVDAGWSADRLRHVIRGLGLSPGDCEIEARTVMKGPLRALKLDVSVSDPQPHRNLNQIRLLIEASDLPAPVKERALAVFVRLADAEAAVHGTTRDTIHFHEVGALDAIVDIVGAVAGQHEMKIQKLYAGPVPLGDGWVETQHGRLPLPAPATLELLSAVGAPTRPAPAPGEWVTPTGAALLAELATFEQPVMTLERVGTGAGERDCEGPNVARLWLGEMEGKGPMLVIETNIDDMNPQLYAAVSERLNAAGARDVWLTPVQMKKGRPGVVLSVLVPADHETVMCELILRETTTLGVRIYPVRRSIAQREMQKIQTRHGQIDVKLKRVNGQLVGVTPEYEACKRVANDTHIPVQEVYEDALVAARGRFCLHTTPTSS